MNSQHQNDRNPAGKQNRLTGEVAEKLGVQETELEKARQSGKLEGILSKLSKNDAERVRAILSDEEQTRKMLESPQARELLKKYFQK